MIAPLHKVHSNSSLSPSKGVSVCVCVCVFVCVCVCVYMCMARERLMDQPPHTWLSCEDCYPTKSLQHCYKDVSSKQFWYGAC